jgi:transcriptional/translational regulatory protein YebC/TACO1
LGKGIKLEEASAVRMPLVFVSISDKEKLERVNNFIKRIEELDDVHKVYSNLEVQ